MVYFDPLKPCPKNMQLNITLDETTSHDSRNRASNSDNRNEQISSKQVGTDIELIEDDDDDARNTPASSPPHLCSESATGRQYPLRQRHPPARLHDYVLS